MENCVWKEKCMRKVGILDLTIQSSFLQLFEKEILKKIEGFEKERKKLHILSILE